MPGGKGWKRGSQTLPKVIQQINQMWCAQFGLHEIQFQYKNKHFSFLIENAQDWKRLLKDPWQRSILQWENMKQIKEDILKDQQKTRSIHLSLKSQSTGSTPEQSNICTHFTLNPEQPKIICSIDLGHVLFTTLYLSVNIDFIFHINAVIQDF